MGTAQLLQGSSGGPFRPECRREPASQPIQGGVQHPRGWISNSSTEAIHLAVCVNWSYACTVLGG